MKRDDHDDEAERAIWDETHGVSDDGDEPEPVGPGRTVDVMLPPPSEPMPVARELVAARYTCAGR